MRGGHRQPRQIEASIRSRADRSYRRQIPLPSACKQDIVQTTAMKLAVKHWRCFADEDRVAVSNALVTWPHGDSGYNDCWAHTGGTDSAFDRLQ
ncbi:hypothetical protein PG996_002133 [Apiospora saccharicola]|uniref:Uncharacterized protein n=1 Tax=Apiospora saccharicola TaxID=335842 RepID=A0ABR1WIQ6_9PEZI